MNRPATSDTRTIDREHQVQLRLIQTVEQLLRDGGNPAEALDTLTDYTRAHFLSEELLMRLYNYPDYDDHVLDHERMLDWLAEIVEARRDGGGRAHALLELKALFLRHIAGRDRQLHDFLAETAA